MAAPPLEWKEGEGYDVHLLRGGPASRRLIDALDLDSSQAALATFVPRLEGGVADHGVEIDASTGTLRAFLHPGPANSRINSFLLTAVFPDLQGTRATEIRIHIHDSVKDIWLTPSSLMVHQGPPECRFTVLARFSDDIVGDITDWPELTYQSADEAVIKAPAGGALRAEAASGSASITVNLRLPSLGIDKTSLPVTALARPSWADVGAQAKVVWVAGRVRPDAGNAGSVRSAIENATNILFVAEGFRQDQRGDFNNLVHIVCQELRTRNYLQPFMLLKDAINYWSVFVPSGEEGVSLLGDYAYEAIHFTGGVIPLPTEPSGTATEWSLTEMIHQVGLPSLEEAEIPFLPDHVRYWKRVYGDHVTEDRTRKFYLPWISLALRSPLNERNSAFGMAIGDRPRASRGERQSGSLRADFRRASEKSLLTFVQSLTYGGHNIGGTWQLGGKDFGLVCFVCLTDLDAGQQRRGKGYFTASLGRYRRAALQLVPGRGLDVKTAAPRVHSRTLFASVWAHECGHALGLWDEYGDGKGTALQDSATIAPHPNVVAKSVIATVTTTTVFDKADAIKWLWPRLTKAGVLAGKPERASSGFHFRVPLRRGHSRAFRVNDVVRFREWPVVHAANVDPFAMFQRFGGFVFKLKAQDADSVGIDLEDASGNLIDVDSPNPSSPDPRSWTDILRSLFDPDSNYALICPRTAAGIDLGLVAEPIFNHIVSKGPLTAKPPTDPGLCVPASDPYSVMTPTNLPPLSVTPRTRADIIGIYEGGSYHDCAVYRPAGRCKMRTAREKTIPFCYVCRYLLVDRVDPTKHGKLDKQYPEVSV